MRKNVGRFIDDAAEARFKQAFDRAMTSWPTRVDLEITTSFGRTVASTVEGPSDGTPVLLLPGGGSTIAPWGPFAEAWSADRTVIAVDTIWDAGRSVQIKPIPSGIEAAAWLNETLDGLGLEVVHIVGFSYGAWVCVNQLVHDPAKLRSVTAIEPPGTITGLPWRTWAKMLRMLFGDEDQYLSYLAWVRGGKLPESATLDLLMASKREFVQRGTPRPERLTKAQWRTLNTPLSVLLSGRSRFISRRAANIVRRSAPSAQVRVFPQASHALLVDEPDAIIHHVRDFLREHDSTHYS